MCVIRFKWIARPTFCSLFYDQVAVLTSLMMLLGSFIQWHVRFRRDLVEPGSNHSSICPLQTLNQ